MAKIKKQETVTDLRQVRLWSLMCHLSGMFGWMIPLGNIFGPLIIWYAKRDSIPDVGEHGRHALNFQFTMVLYFFVSVLLVYWYVGIFMLYAVAVFQMACTCLASFRAYQGKPFHYPLTVEFLK